MNRPAIRRSGDMNSLIHAHTPKRNSGVPATVSVDEVPPAAPQFRVDVDLFRGSSAPARACPESFAALALGAADAGYSDIVLQSEVAPHGRLHGVWCSLGARPWSNVEIEEILASLYRSPAAASEIAGRHILDFAFERRIDRRVVRRFRVNAVGVQSRGGAGGIEVSMRVLPSVTPDFASVGLPAEMLPGLLPERRVGLVVIAGGTGHGKSTTLAAITRGHLESPRPCRVVDFQAPIEYTFDDVQCGAESLIGQSEVGTHIRDFASGVRSALRRSPDIITIGEVRDEETIRAALEASLTGHLVYTTTHAGSAPEAFRRLLSRFGETDRRSLGFDLASSLRAILAQRLIPAAAGRVALREYLEVDDGFRRSLSAAEPDDWPGLLDERMNSGSSSGVIRFASDAARLVREGLLGPEEARPWLEAVR